MQIWVALENPRMETNGRNYLLFRHCSRIIEHAMSALRTRRSHVCLHSAHTNTSAHTRSTYGQRVYVDDSPFAEGRSTNGSISSTNTDTGARIPFRRENASSCILQKRAHSRYIRKNARTHADTHTRTHAVTVSDTRWFAHVHAATLIKTSYLTTIRSNSYLGSEVIS